MPPGPGMLNYLIKAQLKRQVKDLSFKEKVIAKKIVDDIYILRTNSYHIPIVFIVVAILSLLNHSIILFFILLLTAIIAKILFKKYMKYIILKKLSYDEKLIAKKLFPKDL